MSSATRRTLLQALQNQLHHVFCIPTGEHFDYIPSPSSYYLASFQSRLTWIPQQAAALSFLRPVANVPNEALDMARLERIQDTHQRRFRFKAAPSASHKRLFVLEDNDDDDDDGDGDAVRYGD